MADDSNISKDGNKILIKGNFRVQLGEKPGESFVQGLDENGKEFKDKVERDRNRVKINDGDILVTQGEQTVPVMISRPDKAQNGGEFIKSITFAAEGDKPLVIDVRNKPQVNVLRGNVVIKTTANEVMKIKEAKQGSVAFEVTFSDGTKIGALSKGKIELYDSEGNRLATISNGGKEKFEEDKKAERQVIGDFYDKVRAEYEKWAGKNNKQTTDIDKVVRNGADIKAFQKDNPDLVKEAGNLGVGVQPTELFKKNNKRQQSNLLDAAWNMAMKAVNAAMGQGLIASSITPTPEGTANNTLPLAVKLRGGADIPNFS